MNDYILIGDRKIVKLNGIFSVTRVEKSVIIYYEATKEDDIQQRVEVKFENEEKSITFMKTLAEQLKETRKYWPQSATTDN